MVLIECAGEGMLLATHRAVSTGEGGCSFVPPPSAPTTPPISVEDSDLLIPAKSFVDCFTSRVRSSLVSNASSSAWGRHGVG